MLLSYSRLVVASAALLVTPAVFGQAKVAVIDMREAVNATAEVKKAVGALEARLKPKQAEGEKLQREIQDIQAKLQSLQGKLTQQGEADLVTQGQRKQRDLQRLQEDLNAELEREQSDVGSRALQRMRDVVKKLAEEQQLDMVVDISQTVYSKPALAITKAAVDAYDKAYPAK